MPVEAGIQVEDSRYTRESEPRGFGPTGLRGQDGSVETLYRSAHQPTTACERVSTTFLGGQRNNVETTQARVINGRDTAGGFDLRN
jgi:hypothetical protein